MDSWIISAVYAVVFLSSGFAAHYLFKTEFHEDNITPPTCFNIIFYVCASGLFILSAAGLSRQQVGLASHLAMLLLLAAAVVVVYSDVLVKMALTLPLVLFCVGAVACAVWRPEMSVFQASIALLLSFAGLYALDLFALLVFRKHGIGFADMLFLSGVGAFLGIDGAVLTVFLSSVLMLPVIGILVIYTKTTKRAALLTVPYLPGLSVSAILIASISVTPKLLPLLDRLTVL